MIMNVEVDLATLLLKIHSVLDGDQQPRHDHNNCNTTADEARPTYVCKLVVKLSNFASLVAIGLVIHNLEIVVNHLPREHLMGWGGLKKIVNTLIRKIIGALEIHSVSQMQLGNLKILTMEVMFTTLHMGYHS